MKLPLDSRPRCVGRVGKGRQALALRHLNLLVAKLGTEPREFVINTHAIRSLAEIEGLNAPRLVRPDGTHCAYLTFDDVT